MVLEDWAHKASVGASGEHAWFRGGALARAFWFKKVKATDSNWLGAAEIPKSKQADVLG